MNYHLIILITFSLLFNDKHNLIGQGTNLNIDKLKCEYLSSPLNIDTGSPRFSWIIESKERGQYQSAYQVLVSSNFATHDDMWNSGKINHQKLHKSIIKEKNSKAIQDIFGKSAFGINIINYTKV